MADVLDKILVKRLNEYLDPWWLFQCDPKLLDIDKINPVSIFTEDRDEFYDLGRSRFFRDQLLVGNSLDHIVLDCVCNNGHVYPDPLIIDGWHRFAGHLLAGSEIIEASFSGRVDLLDYLTGKTNKKPEE